MRCGLATFSLGALIAGPALADATLVDVRQTRTYDPAATAVIAEIGLPQQITLTGGQSVRSVIEQRCGIVDPTYVAAFIKENRGNRPQLDADALERAADGETFAFPQCVPVETQPARLNSPNLTAAAKGMPLDGKGLHEALTKAKALGAVALRSLRLFSGTAQSSSDSGFVAVEVGRLLLRANPSATGLALHPGDRINEIADDRTATVPLRPDVTREDAQAQLSATSVEVNDAVVAELIEDAVLEEGMCRGSDSVDWPIPLADLKVALEDMDRLKPPGFKLRDMPQVLLIDTGYDPAIAPPIIASRLGQMPGWDPESIATYSGINPVTGVYDATPPAGLATRLHGGEVAATLLGGSFLPEGQSYAPLPLVTFASIAAVRGADEPYLDIAGIRRSFAVAVEKDLEIVNASVAAERDRPEFETLLKSTANVLLVAAAGNVVSPPQIFTAKSNKWPGSMGGAVFPIVVSVGAHDPDGKLLPFSRKGRELDILAPGCNIPTWGLKDGRNDRVRRNGTSYAAPIVTFVATQLWRAKLTPARIKDRILISADVDDGIAYDSWSGGRLNVRKALSLWRSYVVYDALNPDQKTFTRRTIVGQLRSAKQQVLFCKGQVFSQSEMRKLTRSDPPPDKPDASVTWRGWRRLAKPTAATAIEKLAECRGDELTEASAPIEILTDANETVFIPIADIRDFVAAVGPGS